MLYTTLAEVKSALSITDTADDTAIERAIEAASRMIDQHAHRRFDIDAVVTTRLTQFETSGRAISADIGDVTGLVVEVDEAGDGAWQTWAEGVDFTLFPLNAADDGEPFTFVGSLGTRTAPTRPGSVRITALHGWPSVPAEVAQATMIQALRLHQRRHSPYGIAGSPEIGSEMRLLSRLDPDVEALIRPLVRGWYVR